MGLSDPERRGEEYTHEAGNFPSETTRYATTRGRERVRSKRTLSTETLPVFALYVSKILGAYLKNLPSSPLVW